MTTQSVKVTKTAQELIYSVSNAIRILGRKYNGIKVQVWFNCIYVWAKGQVSRFVAKAQFRHQFVAFRKQGAIGLNVQPVPFEDGEFLVGSSTGETAYLAVPHRQVSLHLSRFSSPGHSDEKSLLQALLRNIESSRFQFIG